MSFRFLIASGALVAMIASTPQITEINPATPAASTTAQTLTISGSDFLPGVSLEVQTPDSRTFIVSGSAVTVRNPGSLTASAVFDLPGAYLMKAVNTDGGQSRPFSFQVRDGKPQTLSITIDRVVPDAPNKSEAPQTVRLEGRDLDSGISVSVMDPAGSDVPNVSVGKATSTSIDVTLLLNQRGEYVLQASNRAGATSNRVTIRVQ